MVETIYVIFKSHIQEKTKTRANSYIKYIKIGEVNM